jgi:acetyl/propionyl-CoA carboxylase alpha subunit/acetyl-CoA carboxylase carboxyltransferase component
MRSDFRRIVIVNRAEPALRLVRAVRDFNRQYGTSLETVALYAAPDRGALYVREADAAVDLGDGPLVEDERGRRHVVYLDASRLERGLAEADADAVWAGWGFVSERPDFVDLCDRLGLVFIGPSAEAMRTVTDKIALKRLARHLGIPVVPAGRGPADTLGQARADAQALGYPVVVKATMGAGGRGIRRVESEAQLASAFEQVRDEASRLFDDPQVFIERWLSGSRHVEVQVAADSHGTAWALGTRDCSIQRRYQKLVQEAPAAFLAPAQDAALKEDALRLCRAAGYDSVGTVEFLVDPASGAHCLMEMNARQQVEHAVTELTTGVDLVKLQLHLARGGRLDGSPPASTGVAVEARLNAEDAEQGFAPAPGRLIVLRVAPRAGLRLDAGVGEGDLIPPEYDSMFAKLAATGRSRFEALEALANGLAEASVVIEGGVTNRAALLHLLRHPDVRKNAVDVDWLDRLAGRREHVSPDFADVALVQAAVEACDAAFESERDEFFATAARQRPVVRAGIGRTFEMRLRGHTYDMEVLRQGQLHYRVLADGRRIDVIVERATATERLLTYAGRRYRTQSIVQGLTHIVEVEHTLHRISRDEAGIVRAFSPAVVVTVPVKPGDRVAAGDALVVLESMKMETAVTAPAPGTVRDVWVLANAQVGSGVPLLRLDLDSSGEGDGAAGARVAFAGTALAPSPHSAWRSRARAVVAGLKAFAEALAPPDVEAARDLLAELREVMLGSDIAPADVMRAIDEYRALAERLPPADPVMLRLEDDILRIFVDVSALFGRQGTDEDPNEPVSLSAGQYLLTYLRMLEARGAGLPAGFVAKLRTALTHFGSDSLEVTPALKSRLFWLYRAHLHADAQAKVVQAVLERRLRRASELAPDASPAFADLLQQLVAVAADVTPTLVDLARDVHYRYFVQPVFERGRQAAYDEIGAHLAYLKRSPDAPDRPTRIAALVDCLHPLGQFLSGRFEDAVPALRDVALEVLTRRYYRFRELDTVTLCGVEDRSLLRATFDREGRTHHLFATHSRLDDLDTALAALAARLPDAPDDALLLDLYLAGTSDVSDPDQAIRALAHALTSVPFTRPLHRVVVAVAGASADWAGSATPHFTFRWRDGRYVEEVIYRGLHPMMGKRLEIWRLARFHLSRLPAAEDVYLFHAVAKDNPRDERLFALGEVRELTPVRNARGEVIEVPQLERLLMEAGNGIRQFQLKRAPDERLLWNRISLKVLPPFNLARHELLGIAMRLAPHSEGLGLEKIVIVGPMPDPETGRLRELALTFTNPGRRGVIVKTAVPHDRPLQPLAEYESKVVRMRQRGLTYPYEVVRLLTPDRGDIETDLPPGVFVEHDLDGDGRLVPVSRPWGRNSANIVVGLVRSFTAKCPEGMTRVILLGDPSHEMGSLAEPECRRIEAAIGLAQSMRVPLEWFALSAGARISMQSGTENMDWIARVLRRIVEATQAGQEINVIVAGINVGAQPYWNAEATMLMHTRGILVMMPESAMVLTGKTALDYSGSVSAEDNLGIGGYERVMGPNGQAQYWANGLHEACRILIRHYDHTFVVPGERFPRRAQTSDPADRDVREFPHGKVDIADFATVGDAFSAETNPGRKKPFDIRRVMLSACDRDHDPLERWIGMLDAEIAVVWDAHIGGYPVCLLGFESRPVRRLGFVPTDGPDQWTSGTLFPMASKKTARAINAASGNRPLVVLANLSGFDGSPESMRRRQLEFGAEIGRAVVNFEGPIVFCVVSRYHGGAFVVFSKTLNDNMEVAALSGTHASVIGGAPAAAVVFAREVDARTKKDPRIVALDDEIARADDAARRRLISRRGVLYRTVRSEKLGEVAEEFDAVHSVHRALEVGSLDRIIPAGELRPYLIDAIERGMARERARIVRRV